MTDKTLRTVEGRTVLTVRRGRPEELDALMALYRSAQDFMIESGNPDQWGHFNPRREQIEQDIVDGRCHVLTEGETLRGTFALCTGKDPTYARIDGGTWGWDGPYITIHRIASDGSRSGVFRSAFAYCRAMSPCVRVDTHEKNLPMQRQLERNGFTRRGVIYLANGDPRIAYEWIDQVK